MTIREKDVEKINMSKKRETCLTETRGRFFVRTLIRII